MTDNPYLTPPATPTPSASSNKEDWYWLLIAGGALLLGAALLWNIRKRPTYGGESASAQAASGALGGGAFAPPGFIGGDGFGLPPGQCMTYCSPTQSAPSAQYVGQAATAPLPLSPYDVPSTGGAAYGPVSEGADFPPAQPYPTSYTSYGSPQQQALTDLFIQQSFLTDLATLEASGITPSSQNLPGFIPALPVEAQYFNGFPIRDPLAIPNPYAVQRSALRTALQAQANAQRAINPSGQAITGGRSVAPQLPKRVPIAL